MYGQVASARSRSELAHAAGPSSLVERLRRRPCAFCGAPIAEGRAFLRGGQGYCTVHCVRRSRDVVGGPALLQYYPVVSQLSGFCLEVAPDPPLVATAKARYLEKRSVSSIGTVGADAGAGAGTGDGDSGGEIIGIGGIDGVEGIGGGSSSSPGSKEARGLSVAHRTVRLAVKAPGVFARQVGSSGSASAPLPPAAQS